MKTNIKLLFIIGTIFLLMLILTTAVDLDGIVVEYFNSAGALDDFRNIINNRQQIQNFTLGITGTNEDLTPTGVEIRLMAGGGLTNFILNVSIQEVNATGFPDIVEEGGSGMIAFGQVNVTDIAAAGNGEWINCSLTSYDILQPDTEYFIVLTPSNGQGGGVYTEVDFGDGTYDGGQIAYRDAADGSWTESNLNDWQFYVYGEQTQYLYKENSQTYSGATTEASIEEFELNVTYNASVTNKIVKFYWNGTQYLPDTTTETGGDTIYTKTINVPSFSVFPANVEFFWEFILTNSTGTHYFNSTKNTQLVSELNLTRCYSGSNSTTMVANFSIRNETDLNLTEAYISAWFEYEVGGGLSKNYTFNSSNSNSSYQLCSSANNLNVSGVVYLTSDVGFYQRNFYFNKLELDNIPDQINMSIPDSSSTNIIIQTRTSGLQPYPNLYVSIFKYFPELNHYEVVVREKTDEYGQFAARLKENTEKYHFIFFDDNNNQLKQSEDMTVACRTTICVLPFVVEDTTNDFERFENATDYDWSFTFNNATNIFTFTWTDISGVSATNWIKVERTLLNGTTLVCNDTSLLASGSLTCNVGSVDASYRGQVFRKIGTGEWNRIGLLQVTVGTDYETYGLEGLAWSFFFLLVLISIGYWNPPAAVMLYIGGVVLLSILHIVYLNPAIMISLFVIGIAFIWAFRSGGRG